MRQTPMQTHRVPRLSIWILAFVGLGLGMLAGHHALQWKRAYGVLVALKTKPRQDFETISTSDPRQEDLVLPLPEGPTRARLYVPKRQRFAVVLGHGIHFRGIDEPRLVGFARSLASAGIVVLTPELGDLTDYRITAQARRVLAQSASWLAERRPISRSRRVGLIGFSFAGGMALLAAAEPSVREKLDFVVSVGGYHDLERTMKFLLTDDEVTPRGVTKRAAHDYGLIVLAYQYVEDLVPAPSCQAARSVLRAWLHEQRALAAALASESSTPETDRLYRLLFEEDLESYRAVLERRLHHERAALAALSPTGRLAAIEANVYLLHGAQDNVIPPSETEWAELELRSLRGRHWQLPAPIGSGRALVTPLLDHVTVGAGPKRGEQMALLDFMAQLM